MYYDFFKVCAQIKGISSFIKLSLSNLIHFYAYEIEPISGNDTEFIKLLQLFFVLCQKSKLNGRSYNQSICFLVYED